MVVPKLDYRLVSCRKGGILSKIMKRMSNGTYRFGAGECLTKKITQKTNMQVSHKCNTRKLDILVSGTLRHTFAIFNYYKGGWRQLKSQFKSKYVRSDSAFLSAKFGRVIELARFARICREPVPIGLRRAVKWSKRSYARCLGTRRKISRASEGTVQTESNWPRQTRDREVRELFLGERKHDGGDEARLDSIEIELGVYLIKFNPRTLRM